MGLGMHPTSLYPRRSRIAPKKEEVGGTEVLARDNNGIVRRAESSRQTTLGLGVVDVSYLTCLYPTRIMRNIPLDDLRSK
jgi:hypothetical protein